MTRMAGHKISTDPTTLAREVLGLTHEDETVTVCSVPDNKVAALARAVLDLTANDLPTRLMREIQVRTLRAAARAATYEEGPTGWNYDCDPATVAAWLDELADDIEEETPNE